MVNILILIYSKRYILHFYLRQRIPKRLVFYHKSLAHQGHYILSFAFGFDKEDEVFQFALAPPYSYSRLQTYLTVLERKAAHLEETFSRECIGYSIVSTINNFHRMIYNSHLGLKQSTR